MSEPSSPPHSQQQDNVAITNTNQLDDLTLPFDNLSLNSTNSNLARFSPVSQEIKHAQYTPKSSDYGKTKLNTYQIIETKSTTENQNNDILKKPTKTKETDNNSIKKALASKKVIEKTDKSNIAFKPTLNTTVASLPISKNIKSQALRNSPFKDTLIQPKPKPTNKQNQPIIKFISTPSTIPSDDLTEKHTKLKSRSTKNKVYRQAKSSKRVKCYKLNKSNLQELKDNDYEGLNFIQPQKSKVNPFDVILTKMERVINQFQSEELIDNFSSHFTTYKNLLSSNLINLTDMWDTQSNLEYKLKQVDKDNTKLKARLLELRKQKMEASLKLDTLKSTYSKEERHHQVITLV